MVSDRCYGLKEETLSSIREVFRRYPELVEVIIYGSRAKGNYRPGSDIDLTLKGERLNLHILNRIANELDDLLLPYSFDLSVYSQIENSDLLDHIQRVGQLFYSASEPAL